MKLLILLLFCTSLSAAPLSLTWVNATQRTDNKPYPLSERGGTNIIYWLANQPTTTKVVAPADTSVTIDVPPGTYRVQGRHFDTGGRKSVLSPMIIKIVPAATTPTPTTPPPDQVADPKPMTKFR